jgi:biopolymer transport protein ExbD/biopolymer transport protein TolR
MGAAVDTGAKRGAVAPVMNVTPLVDVVLVLLIIFMVVTPLLTKQFWIETPKTEEKKAEAPPPTDQKQIVVSVAEGGVVKINAEVVDKDRLASRLSELLRERTEKVVYFNAQPGVPYGDVVALLDTTRAGGATSIAVVTSDMAR